MFRFIKVVLTLLIVLTAAVAASLAWWLHRPLTLRTDVVELSVTQGMSARAVAHALERGGVDVHPVMLYGWVRLTGQTRKIKAGQYEITGNPTPRELWGKLLRGEVAQRSITLAEGLTFTQWREILRKADGLKPDSEGLDATEVMKRLGREAVPPEGRFFPSTYVYPKGSSDIELLRQAMQEMDKRLAQAWAMRGEDSPLKSPDEALILASIVEKETGRPEDRDQIAGVFHNRLKRGMRLQTDPTVIYGMGDKFDGNLRRRDLETDTPFNTYTRKGLPPTPIAMPGQEALLAAVKPAKTDALYFVARGDGTSEFSATLTAHNAAVRKYQLKQK